VKPHVKRGKADAADAGAICEAVARPGMRIVPVETEDRQAVPMMHRTRDFPGRASRCRQPTRSGPSRGLRGRTAAKIPVRLAEFGIVAPKGMHDVERPPALAEEAELPEAARNSTRLLAEQFRDRQAKIEDVTAEIRAAANADASARRLQTIPGI
jgi:transposase